MHPSGLGTRGTSLLWQLSWENLPASQRQVHTHRQTSATAWGWELRLRKEIVRSTFSCPLECPETDQVATAPAAGRRQ